MIAHETSHITWAILFEETALVSDVLWPKIAIKAMC